MAARHDQMPERRSIGDPPDLLNQRCRVGSRKSAQQYRAFLERLSRWWRRFFEQRSHELTKQY
jgi:hypothetical protein